MASFPLACLGIAPAICALADFTIVRRRCEVVLAQGVVDDVLAGHLQLQKHMIRDPS